MKEFTIQKNDAGQRLDRFVAKAAPLLPSSLLQKYIRLKRIKVNNKGAKRDTRLELGDIIQMYINDEFFDKPTETNAFLAVAKPKLNVIYEDNNILLAHKPVGMLCHPDGEWSANTLITHIQAYLYQQGEWNPKNENSFVPALCNRIDRNTEGIVIAAKNATALRILNEKIRTREIDKYYLCIVTGKPNPPSDRLVGHILKNEDRNMVSVRKNATDGTKEAITEYETLVTKNRLSLVQCRILTGRTHQIRAQMAGIGYPLLGDIKYGNSKANRAMHENGQMLCAYKLKFSFETSAGELDYLNGQVFTVEKVSFAEKYFPDFEL